MPTLWSQDMQPQTAKFMVIFCSHELEFAFTHQATFNGAVFRFEILIRPKIEMTICHIYNLTNLPGGRNNCQCCSRPLWIWDDNRDMPLVNIFGARFKGDSLW